MHSTATVASGYDTNPLLLVGTANLPSAVSNAGAWANVDVAFGPFTRLYTQGGVFYSALPAVGLSTTTGFGELRFLRRVAVLDLEARAGGSLSDVAASAEPSGLPPPAPDDAPRLDLPAIARTGDSRSLSGAVALSSLPGLLRGGVALTGVRTVFPYRFTAGSKRPEEVSQAGALAYVDFRYGGVGSSLGARAFRQASLREQQDGTGQEAYGGIWIEPHPELTFRLRGEARSARFPEDGETGRDESGVLGQIGVSLGRVGRLFRLDMAATWMQVSSSASEERAQRAGLLLVLHVQPKAWSR